jgi:hypothetical protein
MRSLWEVRGTEWKSISAVAAGDAVHWDHDSVATVADT